MALAALTAGLAFSNTRTALAHSISYDMTMHHGLPHGIACSFTLGMVLQRAIGKSAERDAVLARVFDVPLAEAPAVLHDFLEGLGVSTRFESYGVTEAESARMITSALDGVRGKNFIGVSGAANDHGSDSMNARELRREAMRIGGESVHRDRVIEVFNPYTEQLIGTVPKATVEDVKRAFAIAKGFRSEAHALRARGDHAQGLGHRRQPHRGARRPHHRRKRPVQEGFALRDRPGQRRAASTAPARRSRTTARSSPATSRRTARSAASTPSATRCSA